MTRVSRTSRLLMVVFSTHLETMLLLHLTPVRSDVVRPSMTIQEETQNIHPPPYSKIYNDSKAEVGGRAKTFRRKRQSEEPDEEESCKTRDSLCESVMKLEEIYSFLRDAAAQHEDVIALKKIGSSHEGRPIYSLEIHDRTSDYFSTVVVEFGIHAREWASVASAVNFIKKLTQEKGDLTRKTRWFIVPTLNPDGYVYSTTVNNMWRKNRSPSSSSKCFGVDLNRNFATGWKEQSTVNSCEEVYSGPSPFSEPESKVMRDFVKSIGPSNIDAYVAVHTCAQSILYPYGYTDQKLRDEDLKRLLGVGNKMAQAMEKVRNCPYTVKPSHELGLDGGASDDFMFDYFKIPIVFTLELGDTSYFDVQDYHHCFHPALPHNMEYLTSECFVALKELAIHLLAGKRRAVPNEIFEGRQGGDRKPLRPSPAHNCTPLKSKFIFIPLVSLLFSNMSY